MRSPTVTPGLRSLGRAALRYCSVVGALGTVITAIVTPFDDDG